MKKRITNIVTSIKESVVLLRSCRNTPRVRITIDKRGVIRLIGTFVGVLTILFLCFCLGVQYGVTHADVDRLTLITHLLFL